MKKILTLSFVLVSTIMFATGKDENPAASASGAAVIRNGETTFRVIYKSEKEADVKVSILNDKNELVFSERLNNTDGFSRPYNLANLSEGDYTISIEDGFKTTIEKISYRSPKVSKMLNVLRVNSDEGKYLVTAAGKGDETITVNIYDSSNTLVFKSSEETKGDYAKLLNLKSLKGHFTIEMLNENGEVKSVSY